MATGPSTADEGGTAAALRGEAERDGHPCVAKPLANGRCKLHGGMAKGQITAEGRLRALANLRQNWRPCARVSALDAKA